MSPALTVPAMIAGEIDYFAGVGPGVVSASLSGLPFRAVWVSSDKVSYSLVADPKFKTMQELGKKIGVNEHVGKQRSLGYAVDHGREGSHDQRKAHGVPCAEGIERVPEVGESAAESALEDRRNGQQDEQAQIEEGHRA